MDAQLEVGRQAVAADGVGDVATLIKAIRYAVYNGADVINLSLVGDTPSNNLKEVVEWANEKGVVVVAATGNGSGAKLNLNNFPSYPACYGDGGDNNIVLGVSAVGSSDIKSAFASYGNCVDLTAPGEDLMSLGFYYPSNEDFNNYYSFNWNGTSVSAALVSGAAALIKAKDKSLAPAKTVSFLKNNALNIDAKNPVYAGELGSGRLAADKTLSAAFNSSVGYVAKLADVPAVYYVRNNTRHLFSNEATYWSWYRGSWADQGVRVISQSEFDELILGSNITARPGANLVKFQNSPRVYAVTGDKELCRLENDAASQTLYGSTWRERTIIIQNAFELDYLKNKDCLLTSESRYPAASVIQYKNSDDLWYIDGANKRRFNSREAFVVNNFQDKYIIKNIDTSVPYPTSEPIVGLESGIFFYVK